MKAHEIMQECRRYDERLEALGPIAKALGWRDRRQQELRFGVLAEVGDLNGASILDVGCGFGDLCGFLSAMKIDVRYTGIDINPKLLAVAMERNPEGRYEKRDLLHDRLGSGQFDYVLASGLFNAKLEDNEAFARQMISEMFRLCRRGIAFNLMSSYVDYQEAHLHYYKPEGYFGYGKSMTRHVVLRHDYPLYEFTLYLFKDPRMPRGHAGEAEP